MNDDNADGPESLIDMKAAKLSVVRHLHDDDCRRFSLGIRKMSERGPRWS